MKTSKAPIPPASDRGELQLFTDGSFDPKVKSGGWGFVVEENGQSVHAARGSDVGHSNNSFELMAVVKAMAWIETSANGQTITLWSDSAHVLEGCRRWRHIWRNNGWKRIDPNIRARRRAISDAALWQKLDGMLDRNPNVTIGWCRSHSGIAGNEHADALARGQSRQERGFASSASLQQESPTGTQY